MMNTSPFFEKDKILENKVDCPGQILYYIMLKNNNKIIINTKMVNIWIPGS